MTGRKTVYRIRRTSDDSYLMKHFYPIFDGDYRKARLFLRPGDVTKYLNRHRDLENGNLVIEECEVTVTKIIKLEDW